MNVENFGLKIFFACVLMAAQSTWAAYVDSVTVTRVHTRSDGLVFISVSNPPADTCRWYGEHFTFNVDSAAGRAMLSNLLAAKAAGKKVTLWYYSSPAAGANETNGCDQGKISLVSGVGNS
jgi:hypothetical protein